jgi:hypothetical protein
MTILAAMAGAAIGLVGDITGRLSSRRQAEQARRQAIEGEERRRLATLEDESKRVSDRRARDAAEEIVRIFAKNAIHFNEPRGEDLERKLTLIVVTIYSEHLHITDEVLRHRLLEIEHILDAAMSGAVFDGYSLANLAYVGRVNCYRLLGAWLRKESLPAVTEDWRQILDLSERAINDLAENLRAQGMPAHLAAKPTEYY